MYTVLYELTCWHLSDATIIYDDTGQFSKLVYAIHVQRVTQSTHTRDRAAGKQLESQKAPVLVASVAASAVAGIQGMAGLSSPGIVQTTEARTSMHPKYLAGLASVIV